MQSRGVPCNPAIDPKPKPTSQALSPRPNTVNPHELRTKFRLGGTYRELYRVWGGPIKGYTTNLVQGSHDSELRSQGNRHSPASSWSMDVSIFSVASADFVLFSRCTSKLASFNLKQLHVSSENRVSLDNFIWCPLYHPCLDSP